MKTSVERKQTSFRLRTDLLERLHVVAREENRSLNNFVESALMDVLYREPNATTLTQVAGFNSYHSDQQFCHFF